MMGNWDDRSGGDRGRGRDQANWHRDREQGRSGLRSGGYGGGGDDRGFIDRAGDEVRSWFGDDEAQRRREADQRRWEQEQRMTGGRDNDYRGRDDEARGGPDRGDGGPGTFGGGGFGTGWGNQAARSWNRERPGERGGYGASGGDDYRGGEAFRGGGERHYAPGEREGWFSDSHGGERGDRFGGRGGRGGGGAGGGYYGNASDASEYFRGSGLGAEQERGGRVDFASAGRSGGRGRSPASDDLGGGYGPSAYGGGFGSDRHDPHYSEWRRRQIEDLDRDYDEYRREHQSKFENEFGAWRSKRQSQRQALDRVAEHMDVVGSDGSHVGKVDKVRGDRIILAKSDPNAGGVHHSVPCAWVESVDGKVTLNRTAEQAMAEWRSEERSRALFEREDAGSDGPRNLDRAFSGTYGDGKRAELGDRDE